MSEDPDVTEVAGALRVSIGLLVKQLRQIRTAGELTLPESSALARLDRGGATTSSDLARREQISPQSMGATLGALEGRGLAERRQFRAASRWQAGAGCGIRIREDASAPWRFSRPLSQRA